MPNTLRYILSPNYRFLFGILTEEFNPQTSSVLRILNIIYVVFSLFWNYYYYYYFYCEKWSGKYFISYLYLSLCKKLRDADTRTVLVCCHSQKTTAHILLGHGICNRRDKLYLHLRCLPVTWTKGGFSYFLVHLSPWKRFNTKSYYHSMNRTPS